VTLDDMRKLQTDGYDEQAAILLPIVELLNGREFSGNYQQGFQSLSQRRASLDAKPQCHAPLIFYAWY
jgi:hypothetical protein